MKLIKNILAGIGLLCLAAILIFAVQDAPTDENVETKIINDYNVYALNMPEGLEFAEEKVPIDNPDVLEKMDREL